MSERLPPDLLGTGGHDPGCDAAFELMEQYVEAVRRGEDVARYAGFVTHIQNCAACREDTEGLLAALNDLERPPPA
jgi:hypothetical protein